MPYLPKIHDDESTRKWIAHKVVPTHRVWVAADPTTKKVLGFAALKDGILEHLYLLPESRRQGIGSRLLTRVQRASPEGLVLRVFQRNIAAIEFYTVRGFRLTDTDDGARNEEGEPDATFVWRPDRLHTTQTDETARAV